jgi:DNA-binding CsgD family transcriptional regulator
MDRGAPVADAIASADNALASARQVALLRWQASALNTRGAVNARAGDWDASLSDLRHGIVLAREAGDDYETARGMLNLTEALRQHARLVDALGLAREATDFVRRSALGAYFAASAEARLTEVLYEVGDWDEALQLVRAFGTTFPSDSPRADEVHVLVLVDRGLFDEARARLHSPATRGPTAAREYVAYTQGAAKLALWEDRLDDARAILADALSSPFGEHCLYPSLTWLAAWVEADAAERGGGTEPRDPSAFDPTVLAWRDRDRRLLEHGEPNGNRLPIDAALYLELTDGEISRMSGRSDPTVWHRAAESLAEHGYVHRSAYARFRLAEALIVTTQDRLRAVNPLRDAHQTALRLGAQPLLGLIERLAGRARIGLAAGTVDVNDAPFGLTGRELQVLTLVAAGRTNRQIADELFISIKTASVHVSNILAKLNATSRGEAAALAHRFGLNN